MLTLYKNAKIVLADRMADGVVVTENGVIVDVCSRSDVNADRVIDCEGLYLSPGFADIHIHGGGGYSAMSDKPEDIVKMAQAHLKYGTTSILPTTLAAPVKQLQAAIDNITKAKSLCRDAHILGVHLEGPFINMNKKGAQRPENILLPTEENIEALLDYSKEVKMIGAAPEVENGFRVGKEAQKRGIVASVAHSDADFSVAEEALHHGYSDITHIFSAQSAMHKDGIFREVGVAEAGLALDGYTAQFIADLRHLPYGCVKLIYKAKGADKAYAITDGLEFSAMEMKEGTVFMQENGMGVLYEDKVMKLADRSCLAGSVATSHILVRNMVQKCGIPLWDAVKMASTTPLSVVGFGDKKGKIKPGYDADLILFDENIEVKRVEVCGEQAADSG